MLGMAARRLPDRPRKSSSAATCRFPSFGWPAFTSRGAALIAAASPSSSLVLKASAGQRHTVIWQPATSCRPFLKGGDIHPLLCPIVPPTEALLAFLLPDMP